MVLYHFHRILISASILGDMVFTYWCVAAYNRAEAARRAAWGFFENPLVWGVGSTIIVVLMVAYLIYFNRNLVNLRALLSQPVRCEQCGYDLRGSMGKAARTCPECGAAISETVRRRVSTA